MDVNQLVAVVEHAVFRKRTDVPDVLRMAEIDAAWRSGQYYQSHMLTAKNFEDDLTHLTHALGQMSVDGLHLEFGVASGRTINHIAAQRLDYTVYGFDVFSGLPEVWRTGFDEGAFAREALPTVAENVELITGLFEDTLVPFLEEHEGDVGFLHVDCDLYGGTRTILNACKDRIKPGTVIVFDEYFNYPGWEQHEYLAWKQFCAEHDVKYDYISFVSSHQQVAVIVR